MRSFVLTVALAMTSVHLATARVANPEELEGKRDASVNRQHGILNFVRDVFRNKARQEQQVCVEDDIYQALQNDSLAQPFCSQFLDLQPATVVAEYTPTVTDTSTYTTVTSTTTSLIRYTPMATVTISTTTTPGMKAKRNAQVTEAPVRRAAHAVAVGHFIRQAMDNSTSTSSADSSFASQLSSACSCLPPIQSTTTSIYTDEPTHVTQLAQVRKVQVVNTTTTAGTITTTVTDVAVYESSSTTSTSSSSTSSSSTSSSSTSSSSTSSSSTSAATPTSPAFTCPDDNNMTVSQMVGAWRYDYLVLCDTDLTDSTLAPSYSYATFSECVAACSITDSGMNDAVCEGVAFYPSAASGSTDCYLKVSANSTVTAPGTEVAILQRIAVAVTNATTSNATLVSASATDTSAAMSSVLANSTTSMPIITPAPSMSGRLGNAVTSYSTYVSDGSTFSSGFVYSTYYSSNGTWYESYYTTFTEAWTSSTTVIASAQTTEISSNSSSSSSGGGDSGENGSGASGSAGSTTTNSTTITTSSSGNGGASGGSGYEEILNSTTTQESNGIVLVTQNITTIYYSANGTDLGSNSTTYSYSYQDTSGGSGGSGSGSASNTTTTTTIITINNSTGSANGTSGSGSGGSSGSGSANLASTVLYSTIFSTVVVNTYSTAFGSGYGASGISGMSGTVVSGVVTPTGNTSFPTTAYTPSFPGAPRSGTESLSTVSPTIPLYNGTVGIYSTTGPTAPSGSPLPSGNSSTPIGTGTLPSGSRLPTGNSSVPIGTGTSTNFSGSMTDMPRSGTYSTSSTGIPIFNSSSGIHVGPTSTAPSGTPAYSGNSSYPAGPTGTSAISLFTPSYPNGYRSGTIPASSPIPTLNSVSGVYSMPMITGTGTSGVPSPSSNSSFTGPTGTSPHNSSFVGPTGTSPSGTADYRSGTFSTAPTGVSSSIVPSANLTTCIMPTLATTTLWSTYISYGCYESCVPTAAPQGYGNYGGYGALTARAEPTSPARDSEA